MIIYCPVWGDKHIALLENALFKSLSWPKNKAAIKDAEWMITTDSDSSLDRILKIIGGAPYKAAVVPELNIKSIDTGMILIHTLRAVAKECISSQRPMLMATPDFIYGDGTIAAFKTIASEPGTCATIAHLRAVPHMMGELTGVPTNEELMGLAWKHAHISWLNSNAENKPGMTYKGGVKWKYLGPGLRAVQHYMPSPFYVNFLEKDIDSFNQPHEGRPPGFGAYDHVWPSSLIEDGRLRYIGSSDAAMMVEMTDPNMNVPPWNEPTDPPGFFRDHFHNKIQSQFISIFRGKEESWESL